MFENDGLHETRQSVNKSLLKMLIILADIAKRSKKMN